MQSSWSSAGVKTVVPLTFSVSPGGWADNRALKTENS